MSDSTSGTSGATTAAHPYLLDGRRVTIGDLLQAGLLTDHTKLTFHRTRKKETHLAEATTDEGGGIRLLASGKVFRSPSRAARIAVGYGSFDGWSAWQVEDGQYLDDLRQQLLDQVATQNQPTAESAGGERSAGEQNAPRLTVAERHERLKEARRAVKAGQPMSLSVRELLGWWGQAAAAIWCGSRSTRTWRTTAWPPRRTSSRWGSMPRSC
ncbi:hypothetical protein [Streptomyces sp. NPDC050528]|uniref:restriction system modified-DNA reader domain-containing protein n=1 Tax=Streptomyces sp. NPDC050528 TaxID=3365623 RepID=UPI003791B076